MYFTIENEKHNRMSSIDIDAIRDNVNLEPQATVDQLLAEFILTLIVFIIHLQKLV